MTENPRGEIKTPNLSCTGAAAAGVVQSIITAVTKVKINAIIWVL
ncbi:MAG: hypothetical protein ACE1ZE_05300 [Candidatus Binatia bacterium]